MSAIFNDLGGKQMVSDLTLNNLLYSNLGDLPIEIIRKCRPKTLYLLILNNITIYLNNSSGFRSWNHHNNKNNDRNNRENRN